MKKSKNNSLEETEKTIEVFSLEGNITKKSILTKDCDIKKFLNSCCFGIFYKITRDGKVLGSGRIEVEGEKEVSGYINESHPKKNNKILK